MYRELSATLALIALLCVAPSVAGAHTSAVDPGGRVLLHEDFRSDHHDGAGVSGLIGQAMLSSDGTVDRTFGRNGFLVADPAEDIVPDNAQLAYDSQGRIVVAFHRVLYRLGFPDTYIAYVRRLAADGSPDPSFGPGGTREIAAGAVDLHVAGLVVLAGDELLVGGSVPDPGRAGQRRLAVLKLGADGTPDPDFGEGGTATATPDALRPVMRSGARQLRILDDGRILAGGEEVIARFRPDGTLDEGFGAGGVITSFYLSAVAADGTATYVASSPGPPGGIGIVVERLLENGSRDTSWGASGVAEFPLAHRQYVDDNGDGEPDGGTQISYAPGDLVVMPGGGLAVGATEAREDYSFVHQGNGPCPTGAGIPLLVAADGDPGAVLARAGTQIEHVILDPDGGLRVTGQRDVLDEGACPQGEALVESSGFMARYDADGDLIGQTIVAPVRTPPDVAIAQGPSTAAGAVTGDPSFRFDVTPAPEDGGDVVLRCSIDSAPWQPCAATHTFTGVPEGARGLRVQALGVNGARSPISEHAWTQNQAAPRTSFTEAPRGRIATRSATVAFAASEPALFACSVDGGAAAPCESPLRLTDLADGAHEVKVTATDTLGAVELQPATASWSVDTSQPPIQPSPSPQSAPSPPSQPAPQSAPPPPATQPAIALTVVSARRGGPFVVMVRAPAEARVQVRGRLLRRGRRAIPLRTARGRAPASGRLKLELRLRRKARRALARTRGTVRLRVTALVTVDDRRRALTATARLRGR